MPAFIDLTGQKFGKLTVIERAQYKSGRTAFKCVCECGNTKVIQSALLIAGKTRSCGCLAANNTNQTTHGKSHTKLYGVWCSMKSRCNNPNVEHYKNYGGRGIKVCKEWGNDFQSFYDWAYSNGYKDGLTIDRIDVNKGYSPDNCRWSTMKEQCNNRVSNRYFTHNGKTQTLAQWAEETGIRYGTLRFRIMELHYSFSKAIGEVT